MIKIEKETTKLHLKIYELENRIHRMEIKEQAFINIINAMNDKIKKLDGILKDDFYVEVFKND